ncbi:MAG TPA: hypothetical protein VG867_04135 [Rhizomicrobium sp.]|nr:hypothetical protein [Rhizomicrobium sp.]
MKMRAGLVVISLLALGGCAIFGGPADRAMRRTPDFRAGYSDGCAAATAPSANPRDERDSLKGESTTYRRGYATGFSACRRGTVSPGTAPDPGLGNGVPVPGRG